MKDTKIFKRIISALMVVMMLFVSSSAVLIASAASAKKLSSCKISVASTVAYTGKALKPTVTVKDGKTKLKKGTHYTVSYSSNKNFGTAKVVVTAKKGSGYTGSKTLNFKIVPAKVKSLKATSTKTAITLSWKKVKGATKYVVYSYNSSSKKYTKVTTVKTNKATVKKLTAGKTYSYAVKAVAVKNNKTYNGTKSAVLKCATAPKKVTGLAKGTVKDTSVVLNWTKVSGATGYKVYTYNSSTKKYTQVANVTTNKATVKSLKASTTYKFAVRAYRKVSGKAYHGAYSDKLSVKTAAAAVTAPAKVTGLKASTVKADSVTLTWTKVSGATGYQVCSYNSSTKQYTPLTTVTANKATISSLTALTTYKYAVRAYKTAPGKTVYGSYSSNLSVKTLPAKVTGLKSSSIKPLAVTLTWTKVSGATGYKVYSYNSTTKKYTALTTVKTNTFTVTPLKASTSYSFAVRAYVTESGTTTYGDYSSLLTVKTSAGSAKEYLSEYQSIFNSGTYRVDFTMNLADMEAMIGEDLGMEDLGIDLSEVELEMFVATKKKVTKMTGLIIFIDFNFYTDPGSNKGYFYSELMGTYDEFSKDEIEAFGTELITEMFSPQAASSTVTESTATIGGEKYLCASYTAASSGAVVKYYFSGDGTLKIIEHTFSDGTRTKLPISNVSSTVSNSDISLPDGFPNGYTTE